MNHRSNLIKGAAIAGTALVLSSTASAQVSLPDMSGDIATVAAFIAAIGAGVLGLIFAAKAFKWARRAG